jgi:predicted Zn-dependent peptidase
VQAVTRLENGLTIVTAVMPNMASISVGLWIGVGGRFEPVHLNGVAHFIEHMLFKGTHRRTARQISQDIEGIGGYLNAYTSEDHTCFYSKALRHRFEDLIDVLFDMLLNSKFAPGDIRREREVIKEEVAMYLDQPQQHVQELFNETMWPNHALGRPLTGSFASLERIGRAELLDFLRTHYTASSIVVSAAGALDHESIVAAVRKRTRHLPLVRPRRYDPFVGAPTRTAAVRLLTKPTEQSQIAFGFRTCSRHDPRRFAVRLLNIVLGENMSSRLFQVIREDRGLAYSIYTTPSFWDDVGDLVISGGLDSEKIEAVIRLVMKELRRLGQVRIGRGELRRAHDYAIGQMELGLENTENHMTWLGEQMVTSGQLISINRIKRQFARVDAAAIRSAAREFFRPERCALAAVSPLRSDRLLRRALAT